MQQCDKVRFAPYPAASLPGPVAEDAFRSATLDPSAEPDWLKGSAQCPEGERTSPSDMDGFRSHLNVLHGEILDREKAEKEKEKEKEMEKAKGKGKEKGQKEPNAKAKAADKAKPKAKAKPKERTVGVLV